MRERERDRKRVRERNINTVLISNAKTKFALSVLYTAPIFIC